jgi:hydroxypyruvate isomerase
MTAISRRKAIKATLASGVLLAGNHLVASVNQSNKKQPAKQPVKEPLKGNIRHSVSKWCFRDYSLDEFCKICKNIGIESIELLGPEEWPVVKANGLTVAMAQGAGLGIDRSFNDPQLHDELVASYEKVIPMVAEAGLTNLICFSGRRNGVTDLQGWENCEKGLKRITPVAEKYKVVLTMELLNSVGHKDYLCDHTVWGVELCKRVGSPNLKLLYDIYHMQIMEGNIIENIRNYHAYFSHIHTGGNPGRNEIDETQELYYPAIMKALVDVGFKGFVGQEFVPKQPDKLASLEKCIRLCDV